MLIHSLNHTCDADTHVKNFIFTASHALYPPIYSPRTYSRITSPIQLQTAVIFLYVPFEYAILKFACKATIIVCAN